MKGYYTISTPEIEVLEKNGCVGKSPVLLRIITCITVLK